MLEGGEPDGHGDGHQDGHGDEAEWLVQGFQVPLNFYISSN